jgi:homocysteine S-methyltransferase
MPAEPSLMKVPPGPVQLPERVADHAAPPVVLDGGLATRLEARGHDLSSHLWSARMLLDDPGEVRAVHLDFFAAGAEVATTASYQVSFEGLARTGASEAETERLLRLSVSVAREAAEEGAGTRWVAASVGPYGAALADGSEYRGDYGRSVTDLRAWHRRRLAVLAEAEPDVLALETIPCLAEAEALLAEVAGLGVPCWLSLTNVGLTTRRGEPLAEAFAMTRDVPEVMAVGVNCGAASGVAEVVAMAAEVSAKPVVVYPNSGEAWNPAARRWGGPARFDPSDAPRWAEAGARLVGGCCRVTPAEIHDVATLLAEPASRHTAP